MQVKNFKTKVLTGLVAIMPPIIISTPKTPVAFLQETKKYVY